MTSHKYHLTQDLRLNKAGVTLTPFVANSINPDRVEVDPSVYKDDLTPEVVESLVNSGVLIAIAHESKTSSSSTSKKAEA